MRIKTKHTLLAFILIIFFIATTNIVFAYGNNIKIEGCNITTDSSYEQTYAKIYLGEDHSNENVKIQIYYSNNGKSLNQGKKVLKTVDQTGCIEVKSKKPLKQYPDYAKINLYNSKGNKLLDSKSVNLVEFSEQQNFIFNYNNPIKIKALLITTHNVNKQTYAKIYLGEDHSNENVKIQIYYSNNGKSLNQGKKVLKTVDQTGCIEVKSKKPLKQYPDYAKINLYNSKGNKLLDSKSVKLVPTNGSQIFYAPNVTISSSNNKVKSYTSSKNNYYSGTHRTYIGNRNTGKFHNPGCRGVSRMKSSNKVFFSSRQEAINRGYLSCALCNP